MGTREPYDAKLECPNCGAKGEAKLSEASNPVHDPNPRREVEELPDGFEWVTGGTWAQGPSFSCKNCGTIVRPV